MPIPFGISAETRQPLRGIDQASLDHFTRSPDSDASLRDPLDLKTVDRSKHRGVVGDIRDPNNLAETGWGVIYAPSVTQPMKDALAPLIGRREERMKRPATIFEGDDGVLPGDSAKSWLKRRPKPIRLDIVIPSLGIPYYLLIVGPPEEISFEFQYALDLYWAVGRIWFTSPDDYRQYADSVVGYETMAADRLPTSKQMAVFATCHDFDGASQAFSRDIGGTLVTGTDDVPRAGINQGFALQSFIGPSALRQNLLNVFTGAIEGGTPALFFSGTHGKAFEADNEEAQSASQGALICGDWKGVGSPFTRDHYFEAFDLANSPARLQGMIHFMFACYGGGYPAFDTFCRNGGEPKKIANRPMVARLPQVLLSHRDGGALAVLAHVDRAWAYSFREGNTPQTQGFRDVIAKIMWGDRLGQATDEFNKRWAVLSGTLAEMLDKAQKPSNTVNPKALANQWVARDDARNYIVFGDPAVQLRVNDLAEAKLTAKE